MSEQDIGPSEENKGKASYLLGPNAVLSTSKKKKLLNKVLPDLCKAAGVKRKTAHCLSVTCASSLFNAGVEEKLIRERTGHRSQRGK